MDVFIGKWELTSSENMNTLMEALEVDYLKRKIFKEVKLTISIKKNGDTIQMKTKSTIRTTEMSFKLGEEFDETTLDGRKVKSLVIFEDGKLKHVQKWDGQELSLMTVTVKSRFIFLCTHSHTTEGGR